MVASQRAMAGDQPLLLDVVINGHAIDKIGEFVLRDGALLARLDELRSLGIVMPTPTPNSATDLVPIADTPGLASQLDQTTQTIYLTVTDDRLTPTVLNPGRDDPAAVESGTGATLDYDFFGTSAGHRAFADGLIDLRLFSPRGVASTGFVVRAGGGGTGAGGGSRAIRLDTTYTVSDVARLRRYRFGDFITGALEWTRPIRLAGAQVVRDFGVRPDLVTFPTPSVNGSVAVPSTIDVLVNGVRRFEGEVPAGPFQIGQLPVVNGAGTVSTRITNALGGQVMTDLPFYASVSLLAPGLQSYSAQLGVVRSDWGFRSNHYGRLAATGSYRRGLSPRLTIEATAEATGGLLMAGAGMVVNVDDVALVNIAGAASTSRGATDAELAVGVQHTGPIFTLAASAIIAGRKFRDVAATQGDPIARRQLRASAGLSLGQMGTLSLAYAGLDRGRDGYAGDPLLPPGPGPLDPLSLPPVSFLPVERARLVSGSYSAQWRSVSFHATAFRDFARRKAHGLTLSATLPLGRRDSASATAASGPGGDRLQAQASRTPMSIGDWGYQFASSSGSGGGRFGQVRYRSGLAEFSAGVDRSSGRSSARVGARGSVSWVDGGVFLSNAIPDSFAVVDTGGVGGVRVLLENREVGRTDAKGRLLVPDLRSFGANNLSVDPLDVPVDASIGTVAKVVRPFDRSGVVVSFPITVSHGALLHLVDASGRALPLGGAATLKSTGEVVPIGYDGAAYVENLREANVLLVERPDATRCTVRFAYRPSRGAVTKIGPLQCIEHDG